jgi:hypothetical protein
MDSNNFTNLAVYKKALEIFKVSRVIACSVSDNKHIIELDFSVNPNEKVAGEIVSDSLRLVPELAAVQNSSNNRIQLKRANRLRKSARLILSKCRKMEYQGVREMEFIDILRNELQQFDQLFSEWLYNLQLKKKRN